MSDNFNSAVMHSESATDYLVTEVSPGEKPDYSASWLLKNYEVICWHSEYKGVSACQIFFSSTTCGHPGNSQ